MEKNIICIKELDLEKQFFLNTSKTSWIKIIKFSKEKLNIEYDKLWDLKPTEKHKIKIFGKEISCPRYTKLYYKPYRFAGLVHKTEEIVPQVIDDLLQFSKIKNKMVNQCLVNWYEPDGYIGRHSDKDGELCPLSEIFSFSFGPAIRIFKLISKNKLDKSLKIQLEDNMLVIMGGECQKTHYHMVEKNKRDIVNTRINVTFRCFL